MAAISTRQPSITISYLTARGTRRSKNFAGNDLAAARAFFAQKLAAAADPQITGAKPADWDAAGDVATEELTAAVNIAIEANPAPVRTKLGVAPNTKTRAYYAGVEIAKRGMAGGVTKEMILAVDQAYGKRSNLIESEIACRSVWHGLAGAGFQTAAAAQ
ncbi:hypothetical protein [Lacipirellula sp.]|uniref:hypothetical protein n=1 Tax=Lacipirellula sp. TaxID=2691419 RepID=UPI003D139D2C